MGSDEPVQEPVPNAQSNLGPRDIIAMHKQDSKGTFSRQDNHHSTRLCMVRRGKSTMSPRTFRTQTRSLELCHFPSAAAAQADRTTLWCPSTQHRSVQALCALTRPSGKELRARCAEKFR